MSYLQELFYWFIDNQEELVKQYNGKYLIIKDFKVIDSFDDENTAYYEACEKYGLGNFIIQLCIPGEEAYTIVMNTPRYNPVIEK